MKKKIKISIIILSIVFLSGCQSIKKTFAPSKKSGSDEFLVKKKSPLVMPPSYNDLPRPISETLNAKKETKNLDVKLLIVNDNTKVTQDKEIKDTNKSLEQLILKKINNK